MSPLEIVGGILIIISAIALTIVTALQEGKGGMSAFTGNNESSFAKSRVKTLDAMLSRATKVIGIAFVALTLAVNIAAVLIK